ncbi:MAG: methyltransferase [Nanoarchaeota archaeon]
MNKETKTQKEMKNKKMKFAVKCIKDFEEIAAKEAKDLISVSPELGESYIFFDATIEKIAKYVYLAQSPRIVLNLLMKSDERKSEGNSEKEIMSKIEKSDFSFIDGSFAVRCSKHSLEREIGSLIYKQLDKPIVSMESPDYPLYLDILDRSYVLGINITDMELDKRGYKIFSHPSSIKGTLGYSLVAISGYKGKGLFLDPCAGSGTICAEAAYSATKFPIRFFEKEKLFSSKFFTKFLDEDSSEDQYLNKLEKTKNIDPKSINIRAYDVDLQSVNAMKKNFKIGGIENNISVGRGDIDWLETKFKENSVDFIVTNPPSYTKFTEKKIDKFYNKFFYQTEFILSKEGKMVILTNSLKPIEIAKKYKLDGNIEKTSSKGDMKRNIISFRKIK